MTIQFFKTPNQSSRTTNLIDTIVIHHTNMVNCEAVIQRFLDPTTEVSSHYLVSKDGDLIQFVDEDNKAYHAGLSYWRGREKINDYSIGIELDNTGNEEFPEAQITALLKLLEGIYSRRKIDNRNLIAHYDIATNRKDDPNEYFPWRRLFESGYGIYATLEKKISAKFIAEDTLKAALRQFGYLINDNTNTLAMAVKAFRKHYSIEALNCDFSWDELSDNRLNLLLNSCID